MEQAVIHSPLGPLTLFAEDDHLTALVYGDYGSYDDLPLFREAKRQLEAYFAGQRQAFSLPLNPDGTAFQRRVWQSLCDIPYGRVISYRELAAQVGSPRAFQAVGQANGRNPLPILIPCHRVIAADGTLGGYSSGVERKRFLLRLEGLSIPESKPPRRVGKRGVRARCDVALHPALPAFSQGRGVWQASQVKNPCPRPNGAWDRGLLFSKWKETERRQGHLWGLTCACQVVARSLDFLLYLLIIQGFGV